MSSDSVFLTKETGFKNSFGMKVHLLAFVALIFVTISGCRSSSLNNTSDIPIPEGLSHQDAKLAIVLPNATNFMTAGETITDNALRAVLGFRYTSASRRNPWFIEDIRADSVVVGYDNGKHYFQTEYQVKAGVIHPRILNSRNLEKPGGRIHSNVFVWLGGLESDIRKAMGQIVASRIGMGVQGGQGSQGS